MDRVNRHYLKCFGIGLPVACGTATPPYCVAY